MIAKTLDLSIKLNETGKEKADKYYFISGHRYYNYIDNETWTNFIDEMKNKYPSAYAEYGEGAGNELGIKNIGRFPPKMASYGSSSKMIYMLSRDIDGFQFEKKLPTTIGGIANLDGFLQREGKQFYIEAKCREPYSHKSYIIDRKYEALYRYINKEQSINLHCDIAIIDDNKMQVQFIANDTKITAFDIKQMISHLLGIATEKLNNPTEEKIEFLYLLYNPTNITIVNPKHSKKITEAYNIQVNECERIPFVTLFSIILCYLHSVKNVGIATEKDITKIKSAFSFKRCDQFDYKTLLTGL